MNVIDVMKRIHDIDLAISKINDETQPLSDSDRNHIHMYLADYKECLKSRTVAGSFTKSN